MQYSTHNARCLAIAERLIIVTVLWLTLAMPEAAFCSSASNKLAESDAATIMKDMNTVTEAYNQYYTQHGKMAVDLNELRAAGLLMTDYNSVAYMDNAAGFNGSPDVIDAGDGSQWATIVDSGISGRSTAACRKINEMMLGFASNAAIPEAAWTSVDSVHKFDAIPTEFKNKKFYCVKIENMYDIVQIVRPKE